MRQQTPLLASVLVFLAVLPLRAQDFSKEAAKVSIRKVPAFKVDKSTPPVVPDPALAALLSVNGYKVAADGSISRSSPTITITREMLKGAGLDFTKGGRLAYKDHLDDESSLVKDEQLIGILDGLIKFANVQGLSPREIGKVLQAWGIPQAFDGVHLMNPDGTATYYGLMLYQGIYDKPDAIKMMSGERLSKSLHLFGDAYGQAFHQASPDIAGGKIKRAWDMLRWDKLQAGETALNLRPYADMGSAMSGFKNNIAREPTAVSGRSGDPKYKEELNASLKALNDLEKYRYHKDLDIPGKVPTPGEKKPDDKKLPGPISVGPISVMEEAAPPKHGLLPGLLKTLDSINGKPLTADQQEWLIKSFPMGEVVWRAHAQDLWKAGLTGHGVKVAVIDTGVGHHADIDDSVKSRQTFTNQRGNALEGHHATHVAGTVHALAPEAEIRSYQALEDSFFTNRQVAMRGGDEVDQALMKAVDKAVADGNHVINMSLGGGGAPSGPLSSKIEEYARKGVVFVISAGNAAGSGVESPSNAPSAITSGALDVNDRMTSFSSYGSAFDASKLSDAVKTVFMTPGQNTVSTVPGMILGDKNKYEAMSGTSMSAPDMSGTVALLVQGYKNFNLAPDPVTMSARIKDALKGSGRAIPRNELPSGVPPEQEFIIVDPNAAYQALKPKGSG